jgi:uncharacterized protein (DUF1499 family)
MEEPTISRAAKLASRSGGLAVLLVALGASVAFFGLAAPLVGFLLFALGLLASLVALVSAVIGLVATRDGRVSGRGGALAGLLVAIVILAVAVNGASSGRGLPRINDISTDLDDPPRFVAALELGPNHGRDMDYPGESFARQQMAGYPDLRALETPLQPTVALERVLDAIRALPRTRIVLVESERGHVEAVQSSALFHFLDDFVVRVSPVASGGSRIDMRSKSRDGKGDLGANAVRIRAVLGAIGSAS